MDFKAVGGSPHRRRGRVVAPRMGALALLELKRATFAATGGAPTSWAGCARAEQAAAIPFPVLNTPASLAISRAPGSIRGRGALEGMAEPASKREFPMDRKTATLVGAAAALASSPAIAAPGAEQARLLPVAASYAELLEPIPNAVEQLRLADAEAAAQPPRLIPAQYARHHHHHHHHHHHYSRRWYREHGYYWSGGAWILRPRHHHHHHHHHHHNHY